MFCLSILFVIFSSLYLSDTLLLQNLALELSTAPTIQPLSPVGSMSSTNQSIPLVARVYLKLGTWHWALSPGLDDDKTIQGSLVYNCFHFMIYF